MEKPPVQLDLKAVFRFMTVVAVFCGVQVHLGSEAKIVFSVCWPIAAAFYLIWLLGWLKRRHLLLGLKIAAGIFFVFLLPGIFFCMYGVIALLVCLPFVPLAAIWFWCGLANPKNESV
jgi:hypothetical protein